MGNAETKPNDIKIKAPVFEDHKKEYFNHLRKNLKENIKEIESTLSVHPRSSASIIGDLKDYNLWQTFLIKKLESYKSKMNQKTIHYVDNVINYIEKLDDASDKQFVHKLKLFLSSELDGSKSRNSSIIKEEVKSNSSPSKNEILQKSLEYISNNLDNTDHPINKVLKMLIFNFSQKYENELKSFEFNKAENQNNLEKINRASNIPEENKCGKKFVRKSSLNLVNKKSNTLKLSSEEMNTFYSYVKEELKQICFILILSVIKFYNIVEEPAYKIVDYIGEKVNEILISGDLLKFLQKLKFNAKKEILTKYKERFLEFYNIMPKDLAISPYFSFDKDLKSKIKDFVKKKHNYDPEILKEKESNVNIPFSKCLIYLSEINRADSLLKKIDIMYNLRKILLDEIDSFWYNYPINQEVKYVDADNLLSIFIYLIIKSQLSDLIVDIEIIEDFTNKHFKLSRKGILSK